MKLGYSTWGMPATPIDQAIPFLAELGYDGIEICVLPRWITALSTLDRTERTRIAGLLRKHKLALSAIAAHGSLVETDAEKRTENFDRLVEAMDLAVDWTLDGEPPVVETTPGGRPEQYDELKPLLIERLQELAVAAKQRGVVIALEAHVGAVLDIPEHTIDVMKMVDSPHVRLNFDISHFNVMGYSIADSVAMMVPYTAHTHIKDERGRYPDHQFLIPGEGDFDYVTYLQEMNKAGYTGFISAEISIMRQRQPDYDPLAAARQTYEVVDSAFRQAGLR
jgi:sugar phosphate isomerase/epimerase